MKVFYFVLAISLSCSSKSKNLAESTPSNDSSKTKLIQRDSKKEIEFLSKFKKISPNGLHIYWSFDGEEQNSEHPFKGKPLDLRNFWEQLDKKYFINKDTTQSFRSSIYALGQFDLDSLRIALLTRQWSQYSESSIELMIWNKSCGCITSALQLADTFGDEGWYFDKESWIKEFDFGKNLQIISRQKDFYPEDIMSEKGTISDSVWANYLSGNNFTSSQLVDVPKSELRLKNWDDDKQ
jgi:hypothetical protein